MRVARIARIKISKLYVCSGDVVSRNLQQSWRSIPFVEEVGYGMGVRNINVERYY
jgi:hypothetical protein